jgi:hypothetical protein
MHGLKTPFEDLGGGKARAAAKSIWASMPRREKLGRGNRLNREVKGPPIQPNAWDWRFAQGNNIRRRVLGEPVREKDGARKKCESNAATPAKASHPTQGLISD